MKSRPVAKERIVTGFQVRKNAFSLVEMLIVMAIIGILSVAVTVAIPSVMAGRNMSGAVDTINGYLKFARAHAMAENTFVIVCFSQPSTGGHTDLQVISYSSVNGTFSPGATAATQASKVIHVSNVSLCPVGTLDASVTAKLTAAGISVDGINTVDCLANLSNVPTIAPPGSSTTTGPNAFSELIAFSPQGEAILVPVTGTVIGPTTPFYAQIFMGLCPARNGGVISSSKNSSALLIDGGTGQVDVYRS